MAPVDKTRDSEFPIGAKETLTIGGDSPIRISTGHRIQHHEGKCSRPHGHNYKVTVEIEGRIGNEGWIADKGEITSVIDKWDHMFVVEKGDPLIEAFKNSGDEDALIIVDHPPTAEVIAGIMEKEIIENVNPTETMKITMNDVNVSVSETGELCARM